MAWVQDELGGRAVGLPREVGGIPLDEIGATGWGISHVVDVAMDYVDFKLEDDHLRRLDDVSKIEMGFPHDFFKMEMVRQFVYGGMRDEIDNHRGV